MCQSRALRSETRGRACGGVHRASSYLHPWHARCFGVCLMKYTRELPVALLLLALGCGEEVPDTVSDGGTADASTDATVRDGSIADSRAADARSADSGSADARWTHRVPLNHRPDGSACPQERAAPDTSFPCGCTAPEGGVCSCADCTEDSDCTAGLNGRCLELGPIAFAECSYDQCFSDSDCEGGVPCDCRASSSSPAANMCVTGSNCGVDSDCGHDGYCSPSVVNGGCVCLSTALCGDSGACYAGNMKVPCSCGDSCGHGYYCHTPKDECIDDTDCSDGNSCDYDRLTDRWECTYCLPIP
jgi:hypothetical protein